MSGLGSPKKQHCEQELVKMKFFSWWNKTLHWMEYFLYCQDFHEMASFTLVSTATTRVRTKKNKEKFRCKHKNVRENLIDKRHGSRTLKKTVSRPNYISYRKVYFNVLYKIIGVQGGC